MTFTEGMLRNAVGMFPAGVTVVTALDAKEKLLGVTVSSFSSVSLNPPLVLFSLSLKLYSLNAFLQAKAFAINLLCADQLDLSKRFGRALSNKWDQVNYKAGATGAPVLLQRWRFWSVLATQNTMAVTISSWLGGLNT